MKKFLLSLILFILMPIGVYAANYDITDQLIKAEIINNGDLKITELIVMDGTFNGYEKTLSYANSLLQDNLSSAENNSIYNSSGLDLLTIKGKYVDKVDFETFNDSDFETFSLTDYASNGEKAKYTRTTNYNSYTYRLYYKSNNKKVAFLISYLLHDVVVLHSDVAELYWNFITPNDYDDINNIKVQVLLPNKDNSDNFRFWAHGDLAGEINKLSGNNGVIAEIPYMEASSTLDIRLTFDKDLITDQAYVKKDSYLTLDDILTVEEQRAEIANNLREELKAKRKFGLMSTIIMIITIIVLTIFIYFKYGKSPKSSYYSKYNREFIDDYNVEVIDYLMHRKITPNAMSASIMNLIYKKNLSVTEISDTTSKTKEYKFTLENTDNINESEKILIEFLFDKVGKETLNTENKKEFTTTDLKKYAKGTKTCNTFVSSYNTWKNEVVKVGINEQFYVTSSVPKIIGTIVVIISYLVFMYNISNGIDSILIFILILLAFVFLLYSLIVKRKTEKGSEHYSRWQAFKNFLDDFGSFELKELPEIVLWERYLVYATIFGLADKVQKSMNVKIKEIDMSTYDYYPSFVYLNFGPTINNSINNAVNSAYHSQAASYANTHSSSSSGGGFGGGFSSGGGFGGGGSSGHGF